MKIIAQFGKCWWVLHNCKLAIERGHLCIGGLCRCGYWFLMKSTSCMMNEVLCWRVLLLGRCATLRLHRKWYVSWGYLQPCPTLMMLHHSFGSSPTRASFSLTTAIVLVHWLCNLLESQWRNHCRDSSSWMRCAMTRWVDLRVANNIVVWSGEDHWMSFEKLECTGYSQLTRFGNLLLCDHAIFTILRHRRHEVVTARL